MRCRARIARILERSLLHNKNVTIISDDCWGGELYHFLQLPYLTPIAGLWIEPSEYLSFLKNIKNERAFDLGFMASNRDFPVARTPFATLYFMHYSSEHEAKEKFERRQRRICWDNVFFKIDFGKPGYSDKDIKAWNRLALKNSIALYPTNSNLNLSYVHNGTPIPDWRLDGNQMFHVSKRHFDIFKWLNEGKVSKSLSHTLFHYLIGDPLFPIELKKRIFS